MQKSKFRRGNLVRIADNLGKSMEHFEKGCNAIITEAHKTNETGYNNETNTCYEKHVTRYSVMFPETGNTSAWYDEWQLTLISEGGEHLIEDAIVKGDEIRLKNKDIKYIVSIFDSGEISSESILTLFNLIGHHSRFIENGEFYTLHNDWINLYPVFVYIKNSENIDDAKLIFKASGLDKYNIDAVWKAFHE